MCIWLESKLRLAGSHVLRVEWTGGVAMHFRVLALGIFPSIAGDPMGRPYVIVIVSFHIHFVEPHFTAPMVRPRTR